MNERMIELYKEASEFAYKICREEGREGGTQDHIWNTLATGKFAELIVKECCKYLDNEAKRMYALSDKEDTNFQTSLEICAENCYDNIQGIKEHFGVE